MIRCRPGQSVNAERPDQPATNSLNRACPGDGPQPGDLFHEPEAHPKTAATKAPPEITVGDRHPVTGKAHQ